MHSEMIHVEQTSAKLEERSAEPSFAIASAEREEFDALPDDVREEIKLLLAIFRSAARATCKRRIFALNQAPGRSVKTLKRKWAEYHAAHGDWRVLINRAKIPEERGLPEAFIEFLQGWLVANKRVSRQRYLKLVRFWMQGCDDKGRVFRVPGYGTWREYWRAESGKLGRGESENIPPAHSPTCSPAVPDKCPGLPPGWSYANLMRRRLTRAQERMAREGENAARALLPHVLGTRDGLRFLEEVTFDDVKTDFRVVDPASGEVCDLWLLVAFDRATAVCLGYGMRPARVREDGTQEHLKLIDMKQLAGWVLERWGLPAEYPITWRLENGCATFPEATALALQDLSGGAIKVSYARMLGGKSTAGYTERALGNSKSKASHEAHNNLLHNMAGDLPGQTGRRWDVRPADLQAREKHVRECHELAQRLAPDVRGSVEYPVLTIPRSREELNRIFHEMNSRTAHELEGFQEVAEWRPSVFADWQPLSTFPEQASPGYETRTRKESPYERMRRLVAGLEWQRVPRSTLVHFYQETQRVVTVNERGEICITVDKRDFVFMAGEKTGRREDEQGSPPVFPSSRFPVGSKFLAYFHPGEPDFLHLTRLAPHSGYVATWVRRERVRSGDAAALQEAFAYTESAHKAAREHLHRVAAGEAAEVRAVREHNARLLAESEANAAAIEVSDMHAVAPTPGRGNGGPITDSAVAVALDVAQAALRRDAAARRETNGRIARAASEALFPEPHEAAPADDNNAVPGDGDELLDALTAQQEER